ncbi:MAG: EAL domain-containing protein [Burkholderiales bacterium]|nr:EAL domain-containing protein [Burkholderiales bacterium]
MKVVIIEDSELIRNQLVRIISSQPRVHVVGVTGEEEAAVQMILELKPDTVLLDLSLSPGSGLRVLKRIRAAKCASRVLVLTNNADEAIKKQCHAEGISGFFDKSTEAEICLQQLFDWLPPLPANEQLRLQTLRETGLLDVPEQEAFDDIAKLARDIAGTPMALVTLVDQDRQWFLSNQGLPVRETSRSIAFCAHTIQSSEVLEVPDAHTDPRFADNPLVRGDPNIRYYAGVPLVLASGEALGTLCVLDTVRRKLSETQLSSLKTLAHSVVGEIELRRKMLKLEQEVDRRRAAEIQIAHIAMRDVLTQLPNRAALMDRLDQLLRKVARSATQMAFLFVDLDRYKLINDTLGHEMGDAALVEVSNRLMMALRDSDTVARLGGDEFAVLLPEIGSLQAAMAVAAKLNAALGEPSLIRGSRLHFSASIGIAMVPEHGNTVEQIMRHADLAMYQAKHAGGGTAVAFSQTMGARAMDLLALENDLRDALQRDEIIAYYQPQVMLGHAGLCGAEALARWSHPQLGVLGPDKFIGFAETRGFIHQIGQRMLEQAMAQMVMWDARGIYVPRVAVNVSAVELREGYADFVDSALKRHGLAPERLELEITESTLAADNSIAVRVLEILRRKGISIAVDDFGVGYSSLGQLRRMPIDTLKIDKCFVDEVTTNVQDAAIVSAVVTMARSLGLRTMAEGAEDHAHVEALKRLGCDCVQGYVWSKPLPPEEFALWTLAYIRDSNHEDLTTQY